MPASVRAVAPDPSSEEEVVRARLRAAVAAAKRRIALLQRQLDAIERRQAAGELETARLVAYCRQRLAASREALRRCGG